MIRRVAAQTRVELLLTLRRGESLLVLAAIPVGILAFFASVDVLPHPGRAVDFLVPGVLALSVIASAMTSSGIATGFERHAGVLRRLGTTPLGRSGLLAAKSVSLLSLVALQSLVVSAAGAALGYRPRGSMIAAAGLVVLGTIAFGALGFLLAGTLRAETNLAVANGLFLLFLLFGGIVVPVSSLPETLAAIARLLPAEQLASSLRAALDARHARNGDLIGLGIWAVALSFLATIRFRWD